MRFARMLGLRNMREQSFLTTAVQNMKRLVAALLPSDLLSILHSFKQALPASLGKCLFVDGLKRPARNMRAGRFEPIGSGS